MKRVTVSIFQKLSVIEDFKVEKRENSTLSVPEFSEKFKADNTTVARLIDNEETIKD